MGLCPFTRSFYGCSYIHIGCYLMDPVLLIGQYLYSHWVLGVHPGGIKSYRPFPQLGVLPCDRGSVGGSPWLLRFVTVCKSIFGHSALWQCPWNHLYKKVASRLPILLIWVTVVFTAHTLTLVSCQTPAKLYVVWQQPGEPQSQELKQRRGGHMTLAMRRCEFQV